MNNICFEARSALRQMKKLDSLRKAKQLSNDYKSYQYMQQRKAKSNLKRLLAANLVLFFLFTIALICYLTIIDISSHTLHSFGIGYGCISLFCIAYVFFVARLLKSQNINIKFAKITYLSFWILFQVILLFTVLNNYSGEYSFYFIILLWVLETTIPVFDKIEMGIMLSTWIIGSVIAIIILNLSLYSYFFVLATIIISCSLYLTNYYEKMKVLYTQSVIEQKGYLAQRRIDGLFNDLYEEVYEINLNTNEFVLIHSKNSIKPSKMHDNYSSSLSFIESKLLHPEDVEEYEKVFCEENMKKKFKDGCTQIYHECRRLKNDGNYAWVSTLMLREYTTNKNEIRLMQLVQDIDNRKMSENKLKIEAQRDPLTMLYNKSTTQKLIENYISNEGSKGVHAFIIIDMDEFKNINDTNGHFAGDDVLVALSQKLRKYFRETDVLGRIGGDEFVAFIKNIQSIALVCDKVQKLSSALKSYGIEKGYTHRLSISMGIAIYNKDGFTYEELYKSADKALYEAKRNGRDQYKFGSRQDKDENT